MPSKTAAISVELKEDYNIDEFLYPDISMSIQIPDGFEGEVSRVIRLLENNHFEANSRNVYQVMQLKKKLLTEYGRRPERMRFLETYRQLLEKQVKPVGSAIPIELVLVDGLVVILLSIVARFGLSFADEAGKIVARKLLDDDKKQAKRFNMTIEEYRFLKSEALLWVKRKSVYAATAKELRRRRNRSP